MGKQPQSRKKRCVSRHKSRLRKAKNYRKNNLKDLDEIHDTVNKLTYKLNKFDDQLVDELDDKLDDKKIEQKLELNEDLPGLGQFHCLECSRYFIDEPTLEGHKRSKLHKKRVRDMKETPYSHSESEAAAGLGNYTVKRKLESDDDNSLNKKMRKNDKV